MTSDALGYVRCWRCRCWRPVAETVEHTERLADAEVTTRVCADAAVCSRLAQREWCACDADGPRLEHEPDGEGGSP